jgi:hypothetical protein
MSGMGIQVPAITMDFHPATLAVWGVLSVVKMCSRIVACGLCHSCMIKQVSVLPRCLSCFAAEAVLAFCL